MPATVRCAADSAQSRRSRRRSGPRTPGRTRHGVRRGPRRSAASPAPAGQSATSAGCAHRRTAHPRAGRSRRRSVARCRRAAPPAICPGPAVCSGPAGDRPG
ncbi:hypothetical protein G6F63_015464 [Rhizopus arrhizus]|nr:hypothetical protein G6F63_015464 [Rhizopus arrhizus]